MREVAIIGAMLVLAVCGSDQTARAEDGDATVGAKLFLQCRACHAVGTDEASSVGPNLFGVYGAVAGTKPGYAYSPALASSGIKWTQANLDAWLTQPTALVAGTRMAFPGIGSAKARADVIAYLATLTKEPAAQSSRPESQPELK